MHANRTTSRIAGFNTLESLAILCGIMLLTLIAYLHISAPQVQASEEPKEEQVSADSLAAGNLARDIIKVHEFATDQKIFGATFKPKSIDEVLDAIRMYPNLLNVPPPLKHALKMRLINGEKLEEHLALSDGRLELKKS